MHKVIIPIDFSETSLNAARYTAGMLAGKDDLTAVIYHNYETENDYDISLIYQENLKREFLKTGVRTVECENDMGGDLIDNVSRLAQTINTRLIIMGITGKTAIRQVMFGSNTLKLIDRNLFPVMIIPPDALYTGIKNVAFASDFKNVALSTPAAFINSVLDIFQPNLHIIHISKEKNELTETEKEAGKMKLQEMFSKYQTEFHFPVKRDFFSTLDEFIVAEKIDLVVTIPRHKSNLTSLFKTTHTKRLAYHSHIPILAIHL
jgi:nucleotide-binding universal stress UspA family protein